MRITLITACYNSAAVIGTALESVLRQTWPEVEYWVVDGGSMDDVLADDRVLERVTEAFGRSARTNELPHTIYGDIRFVADRRGVGLEELRAEPTVRYYSSRYWRPWMARFGYVPAHPSFYCRRELFEKFGGYQTDYKIAADHELLIRFLVKERVRSVCLPEVMVVMRLGGVSTRSVESTLILNRENIRACRANGIYTNRLMQLGKYVIKIPGLVFKAGY